MRRAVVLMYVGAVLSVVGLVVTWATKGQLHDQLAETLAKTDSTVTASQIDTLVTITLVASTVVGLVGVGLWIWMASANGAGRSWARIVATVLGGLNVLSVLSTVATGRSSGLSTLASLVSLVLAVVIIVLLWRRESSEFFRVASAKR